jgi:phospholipid/cholesterol/gamma-HCH transport system permease protein
MHAAPALDNPPCGHPASVASAQRPRIRFSSEADHAPTAWVEGAWTGVGLQDELARIRRSLRAARRADVSWDLRGVQALDCSGALILWQSWGRQLPERLRLREDHRAFFRLLGAKAANLPARRHLRHSLVEPPFALAAMPRNLLDATVLFGQLVLDGLDALARPARFAWRELSATIYSAGVRALGVTALVGFLVGIVVSYLSALQLHSYGAGSYIVNVLGLGIIRELGPLLASIIVAGRSGSSISAQLGAMRVTQELDALVTFGVSLTQRLVLPRVLALMLVMPLLTIWTDALALLGGMLSAKVSLQIGYGAFAILLPQAVPIVNFWIGLLKAFVFGATIAFVASYFGLRILPNTESLGRETTNSVVASITMIILLDAVFAIVFRNFGLNGQP